MLKRSVPLSFFNSRKYSNILSETPRKDWKVADVTKWARNFVDSDEAIKVLEEQEIDGDSLLRISQQDLVNAGMKLGPASKIIAALNPDISLEHWQQLLEAIDALPPQKVDWKGDPAKDPNLYILSLPNDLNWPTLASPHLFIRTRYDCYDKIWTVIEEAYLKRVRHQGPYVEFERALIQGNSGIGKTAFLNYALFRAIQKGYPVLLETKNHRAYFHGDQVDVEDIGQLKLKRHRDDPSVLVLHDHNPGTEPPILTNGAFVVAPVSPDARNSKEFRKDRCLKRWMPLPSRQELEAMNSVQPQIPSETLNERIDFFGPITRFCLTQTTEDYESKKEELESKLISFRYQQLAPVLRAAAVPTTQEHGLTWLIIQIDTEDLIKPKVAWGTHRIRDKIATYTAEEHFAELENFLAKSFSNPSPEETRPTKEYEVWAASKLSRGMDLPLRCFSEDGVLDPTERLQFHFPQSVVIQTDKLFSVPELIEDSPKIYRSRRNEPALCDIAVVTKYPLVDQDSATQDSATQDSVAQDSAKDTLLLLQATTGMKHDINMKHFKKYADEAIRLKLKHVILVFVVPELNCFKLQPAVLNPALEYCKNQGSISMNESRLDINVAVSEMKPQFLPINSLPTNE